MSDRLNPAALRRIQLQVRPVLRQTRSVHQAGQSARSSDAGDYWPIQGEPWPGARAGVRAPWPGETGLSLDEVRLGLALGVLQ